MTIDQPITVKMSFCLIITVLFLWAGINHGRTMYKYFSQLRAYSKERNQITHATDDSNWRILITAANATMILLGLQLYVFYAFIELLIVGILKESCLSFDIMILLTEFFGDLGFGGLRFFHIWRLKMSFQGSIYELESRLFKSFIIVWIISVLCTLTATISSIFFYDTQYFEPVHHYLSGTGILIQSLLEIVVTIIFCKNLVCLIKLQTSSDIFDAYESQPNISAINTQSMSKIKTKSNKDEKDCENTNLNIEKECTDTGASSGSNMTSIEFKFKPNDKQMNLMNTAAKQAVLTSISAIASLIVSILDFVGNFNYAISVVSAVLSMLVAAIVTKTLWLSFIFAQKDYNNGCNRKHKWCLNLYTWIAKRQFKQINDKMSNEYQIL